jgi:hypothetical protein
MFCATRFLREEGAGMRYFRALLGWMQRLAYALAGIPA